MTIQKSKAHKCKYCGTGFAKENTLTVHMCEQKRRFLQKDEKRVQLGFQTFLRFYHLNTNAKDNKTYEDFCKSSYYNAFVKFGSFVSNVKPLYPEKYIDHIVTSGIKLDKWCDDQNYEKYVIELIYKENVETALERSISTMINWAEDNASEWNHYFLYASANRVVWNIRDGKISPWLILNCNTGKQLINKLNDEQLEIIYPMMDPQRWTLKFKKFPADVELVKEVAKVSNL